MKQVKCVPSDFNSEENLLKMPLWQMTGEQFVELISVGLTQISTIKKKMAEEIVKKDASDDGKYAYGIAGIAKIFHISWASASDMKNSGILDEAISQYGNKIVIDRALAIELAEKRKGLGYRVF
jgi:hypothetical protein